MRRIKMFSMTLLMVSLVKLFPFYSNRKDRLVLYLGLYNDEFLVFKNGKHAMTIFHLVTLNLPKAIRTENKYMLQLCVAPGPKSPRELFSFIKPIKQELEILQSKGFRLSGSSMAVNAHILFASGDIPACAKLAGQSGHVHLRGCRCCIIKAARIENRIFFLLLNYSIK
ncbi:hypothetical protein BCV72DRAFT_221743 [Rhizopus microsporus var. microsporus]|uniref:Uncharacterized protein n=2 Tax=Rhizopus microsporus TaxID=58291 RepID=A0A2G4SPU0_RHIZD|nr:uncharacterized protein RHIMIDRAFT_259926 [Rhizopus microsporus ATCC 52813]ORE10399.1 hypothetical protein BCV72DRAFT_221743 [Rhizopus microsporus var. microsporus]PHZ10798.1 hypothetical protein RHIMIDRAFT_259926 [Rhizopus microsporus ATCC 52813]